MKQIERLINNLSSADSETVKSARNNILQEGETAVPFLVNSLVSSNLILVGEAARLLGFFGKAAIEAVEALVAISYLNNPAVRTKAIASIGLIGEKAEVCIPVLRRYTTDEDINVRRHAIASLGMFGEQGDSAVDELMAALNDDDHVVREFSASVLNGLGGVPLRYMRDLVNVISDVNPAVRLPVTRLVD